MAVAPPPELDLQPLRGNARPLSDWVTTFHLVLVVLDPFTYESSWILQSARRILTAFSGADCRASILVTANDDDTKRFLGPIADEFLVFTDPSRMIVKGLELETLPALVHLDQNLQVVGAAEGWDPEQWHDVADVLAQLMSWTTPQIPGPDDPGAFPGSPAT